MPKDANDKRPLSPHLQVYRPQITSVLSISYRITGVASAFGLFILALWLLSIADIGIAYDGLLDIMNTGLGRIVLYGLAFCHLFHVIGGIRHLAWDFGLGFNLKTVSITGWLSVLVTLGLTAALIMATLPNSMDLLP